MVRRLILAMVAFAAWHAAAQDPPWLKVIQSGDGYLFGGHIEGAFWAFQVPGKKIGTIGKGKTSVPLFSIDDIPIQIAPVTRRAYGKSGTEPLEAQRKYEQDYMRATFPGVKFSDHDFCSNAKVPHGAWAAEVPPVPAAPSTVVHRTQFQVFVTFQVVDTVLVVGSTYGTEAEREAVRAKIDAICRSFVRER